MINLAGLDNIRRTEHHIIASHAQQYATLKTIQKNIVCTFARCPGNTGKLHRARKAEATDTDHIRQTFERAVHRVPQHFAHFACTREEVFLFEQIQRGDCGSARHRMTRISIAMKEFDGVIGALFGGLQHRIVNVVATNHATQWDHTIGYALGEIKHVRNHAIKIRTKIGSHAAKAGNDLIEYQQDAVLVANFAKSFEIAFGRHVPTRTSRDRFDHDGGDVARVVQRQQALLQFQQQVFFPLWFDAVNEGVVHRIVNETEMIHARQKRSAEYFAVGRNTANTHAAEPGAVIATLPTNKNIAMPFAARAVVGKRNFHRRIGGFTAGVAKQYFIQITRR